MAVALPKASSNHAPTAQRDGLEKKYAGRLREELSLSRLVSYVGNRNIPFLRLYRYKEAFAFEFVREFLRRFRLTREDYAFDPFAGMGTTPFACWLEGIPSVGLDRLPIAVFVANALLRLPSLRPGQLSKRYLALEKHVASAEPAEIALDVPIMSLAFDPGILTRLRRWKRLIDDLEEPEQSALLLLFFAILENCSHTSKDGQFLRLTSSKKGTDPDEALRRKVAEAEDDLNRFSQGLVADLERVEERLPRVFLGDAREPQEAVFARPLSAIITSPPYANRYDYTRTYSLELCFHFVKNFQELRSLRHSVLRSHIEARTLAHEEPPHPAVAEVIASLQSHELNNPRIPFMLLGYFVDMAKVIAAWGKRMASGGQVAMVVDNVRFQGEHVPVDLILCELAEAEEFETHEILISRYKGNSSQQMGKYGRMPVRESVVVWRKA
jgi:site-specific DNA-methyltransferase (cytosine-N4-specific)